MRQKIQLLFILFSLGLAQNVSAQFDEDQLGGWYMYFWNTSFKQANSSETTKGQFGMQGDIQYRNWNVMGDLEQLLLRGGFTFVPTGTNVKFTLGYGHITTGAFGESNENVTESRIYQELLMPHKVGKRFNFTHRFRFEQRFVENQDFRTRYRYNLFLTVPLNQETLAQGAIYLSLYNELFMNAQRDIGDGRTVELFDRNRTYFALGYTIKDGMQTQLGYMQQTTNRRKLNPN